ncbi:MAG TPA: PepSY domain-containing protein, partial [Candidatus Acidoferrum sp.]|nr:PepSY domain-containing protein [Candidatus Acidoferrum sp.]
MKLKQLLSWRFSLIFFHRWIGILVGLMFIIWTLSGVVLMYYGIPHYTAGDRLTHLAPLDLSAATVTPQQALDKVGGSPFRLRVSMLDNRPVYRINTGKVFGKWSVVFADTGDVFKGFDQNDVIYALAKQYPEYTETMLYDDYLREPDFFTHSPALQNRFPLHVIDMGNYDKYYVSQNSGEIVMHTTPWTSMLGTLGYNVHTLFFWRQQSWHTSLLMWLSWIGLVMTVLGLVLGIWRFSVKPAFVQRGVAYRTPYSGWWKWHHYAGLIFGVLMFTWVFSGLVSMSAIPGIDESLYTPDQIKAGARTVQGYGEPVDLSTLTLQGLQDAVKRIDGAWPAKELELQVVNGKPYYLAYRTPNADELAHWHSGSAMDFLTPTLEWEHRYIAANDPDAKPFTDFAEPDLLQMAATAMPGL